MTTATLPTKGNAQKAVNLEPKKENLVIRPPNFQTAQFKLIGTAPLVIHNFSAKAEAQIMETQKEGSKAKGKRQREPKDFEAVYQAARHISTDGWDGIPAAAFRNAMISACRVAGLVMTRAKLTIFAEPDGVDAENGKPLVRIYGTPQKHRDHARNDNGTIDIRVRPMWRNWYVLLRVRYDADMFSLESIANLVARTGIQVGVCEGRPDSKESCGCGWGTWEIEKAGA